jgi:hypothetical protein
MSTLTGMNISGHSSNCGMTVFEPLLRIFHETAKQERGEKT